MRWMLLLCLLTACVDANGLERPPDMAIRTVQDGDTAKYAVSWGPAANATGYRLSTSVNVFGQSGSVNILPSPTQNVTSTSASLTLIPATTIESLQVNLSLVGTRGSRVGPARTASWKWIRGSPGIPGPIVVDSSLAFNSLYMPDWVVHLDTVRANQPDGWSCTNRTLTMDEGGLLFSPCLTMRNDTSRVYGYGGVICAAAIYGDTTTVTWARTEHVRSCELATKLDSVMRSRFASAWQPEQRARDSVTFTLRAI